MLDLQFDLFGWHVALWPWSEALPCKTDEATKGKLAYCLHIEGEPGLEDYEFIVALTKAHGFHVAFGRNNPLSANEVNK